MIKKILVFMSGLCLVLCGCSKSDKDTVMKEFSKKINNSDSYYLTGELEMFNNETSHNYDIKVSYTKENNFKVSLKNKSNNHEQIILRNSDGVFVVTPSLNKSFKFQSEWPYNNSQAYLLQVILSDLENDKEMEFISNENQYVLSSKVNYSNNDELEKQRVTLDKNFEVKTVEVLDKSGNVRIKMIFNDIDYDAKFDTDYYKLESSVYSEVESTKETTSIDDISYPMYIPLNTTLSTQDKLETETGERVILTFSGENPFMLIEETASISNEFVTIPVNGEIVMLGDAIGIMDETSLTWHTSDREYYLVSSTLDTSSMLEVANSIGSIPVIK